MLRYFIIMPEDEIRRVLEGSDVELVLPCGSRITKDRDGDIKYHYPPGCDRDEDWAWLNDVEDAVQVIKDLT